MKFQVSLSSLVPFSLAISMVLLLLVGGAQSGPHEEYIDNVVNSFSTMNRSQLLQTWHTDCHRRCNRQLFSHVETACENDPYRIESSGKRSTYLYSDSSSKEGAGSPFLSKDIASVFLRKQSSGSGSMRRLLHRSKRSLIMEECCFSKDCSWEEYAEYCHGHNRMRRERLSDCS
ncbi:hypothetical protein RRG08_023239 [Elysia crispata]|uniref:Uncharacterized protein n=1 Tax=Elysia crispata TaxID=231223 RepID=A0AAE0ZPX5_9GAST|nr:hypothetical protein RRG08_023239 [Elysia crispata]